MRLNASVDPQGTAAKCSLKLRTKEFGTFEHFLTKNKHRDSRLEVFDVLRELAQEKGFTLNGRVKDKLERSKMIVRVLSKEETSGVVVVEDETGKEKMAVKNGTVWVGMIACMDLSWADGCYRLEAVNDLTAKMEVGQCLLREPIQAYRMLFLKGAFSRNDSKESLGIKLLASELASLKQEKLKVDCIVVFGPLIHCKNTAFITGFSELSYDEEVKRLIDLIRAEVGQVNPEAELVFVPSTEDISNIYPIPQPRLGEKKGGREEDDKVRVHHTSNPGTISLQGAKQSYEISLVNCDLIHYIDENRTGRALGDVLQDNLDSYFKQPFYLSNAQEEPFDETNLPGLYNRGDFGHIVVASSRRAPPLAREVRGRVYVSIGALAIDQPNPEEKHYMTLLSIYDGSGPVAPRVKVEALTIG